MDGDKNPVVDFNLCKACGICVNECPKKIIEMTTVESNA
jgi:Pyruvate/2-oxoacid:ferredoxin oxidoreductase delta subunit